MLWNSPKYFGYFPSTSSFINIIAEAYTNTFYSPGFMFYVAPSQTELENIVVDWSARIMGLPDDFLLKNSGGGIIVNTISEAVWYNVHAAKRKKMSELKISNKDPRILKLVGYYTDTNHSSALKALRLKEIPEIR